MWPFKKKSSLGDAIVNIPEKKRLSYGVTAAVLVSVISLCVSAGCFRWCWLILDEQIALRNDFMQLKNSQEQLNLQFDFWAEQLQKERQGLQGEVQPE